MRLSNRKPAINFTKEYCIILAILLGFVLVSVSLGPYSNFDTQTEYAAAASTAQVGLPYATPGNLINQPPIAFYIYGFFLKVFGLSYATGVAAATLFGVGCIFFVYLIGKLVYDVRTGLVAAGLFALVPWHIVLSRSFLIDVPCLFLSLASLFTGILAIQKASLRFVLVSGILFGLALLTKLFAVFTLIPLTLVFVYYTRKNLKRGLKQIVLFSLPSILMYYLWYETISELGFFSVLTHGDFLNFTKPVTPSPFFLSNYLTNNLGSLLLLCVAVSIILSISMRKESPKTSFFDLVCVVTILGTVGVNMFLVLGRGLWVPYVNPVKYDYQLLPSICWLAASLVHKTDAFSESLSAEFRHHKLLFISGLVGLALLISSVLVNIGILQALTGQDYLLFKVEQDVGFSFVRLTPFIEQKYLSSIQASGFVVISLSLLWMIWDKLSQTILRKKS